LVNQKYDAKAVWIAKSKQELPIFIGLLINLFWRSVISTNGKRRM